MTNDVHLQDVGNSGKLLLALDLFFPPILMLPYLLPIELISGVDLI